MYIPDDVNLILTELNNKGYNAYLVGGCVRDAIMGNVPNDYDITTSAEPYEIQKVFENRKTLDIGIKHGTITVFTDAGRQVEVTTYRTDGEYIDNRHPENVTFVSDIGVDLSRRDFTINAIAYNPIDGFVDLFDGRNDIENKVIRCVGDHDVRFNEDALRIIRGLRFASTLNFSIENNTADSIKINCDLIKNVSVERVFIELKKMMVGESFVKIAKDFPCIFNVIMPELSYSNKDITFSIEKAGMCERDFISRFAVLFLNGNDDDAFHAEESLRHFNCDKKTILSVKNLIVAYKSYNKETSVKRTINSLGFEDAKRFFKILRSLQKVEYIEDKFKELYRIEDSGECVFIEDMAISGKDLVSIGFKSNKNMGKILNDLFELVLNSDIPNDKEALLSKAVELKNGYKYF